MTTFFNNFTDSEFRKNFLFLSFFMLLFLGLRIIQGDFRLPDSDEYFATAELLKSGDYFSSTTDFGKAILLTKRPFLYPLLILFPGFMNDLMIVLFQTLLGFFNIYLILKLFKGLGGKSFRLLTVFILLTPSVFIYTHLVMAEALVMTLSLLMALQLTGSFDSKKLLNIQLLLIALIFLKPAFYLFSIISLLFFLFYFVKTKMFRFSVFLPLLFTIGYMGFNKERTGYFHFSSVQNINLIDYNLYLFKAQKEGPEAASQWRDAIYLQAEKLPTFEKQSKFLASEGKKVIQENLISYSIFHFYGSVRGSIDPGRFDLMTLVEKYDTNQGFLNMLSTAGMKKTISNFFEYKYFWIILILIPIFIATLFKWGLIFRYLWERRKRIDFSSSYLLIFISYAILITGPVNASRYMMPLQGILIAYAVISWESYRAKKSSTK
ncbi:hypothetical protein [Flavobacterium microcysteis]|uniref:Glycosyltransferase family 39 protein n=1 Tax=Flavobacterium microcysteis TaxID=2596891 RepID=A0A501QBY3_9FLAO|nr:hypothetical protein [Flavobacterium microcysteis]TPD69854.1 hypothetical protein FJA49_08080 [Flavobacterium microcysteis]